MAERVDAQVDVPRWLPELVFGDLDELNSLNVNFAIERAKKAPRKKIPGE